MTDDRRGAHLRNTLYRRLTSSGRRMTLWRRLAYRIAIPLALAIFRVFWRTCRVVHVAGREHLDAALGKAPSLIPCYWHQHQLFCGKFLLDQRPRLKVGWLVSPSVDGELGAMLIERVGGHAIRGSATHTGARALRDYYQALVQDAISPALTPDGPRGPRYKFKPGAIVLAQMSGRPILPMSYAATRAWRIKWDRFVIPVPFSRIAIAIGEPVYVARTLAARDLEDKQAEMERRLRALFETARGAISGTNAQN